MLRAAHCASTISKQYGLYWTLHLLSFSLEFCYVPGRVPTWLVPIKTLGTESLMSFHSRWHFTHVAQLLLGELKVTHITLLGEDSWKLVLRFLQALPQIPFPFSDFALYLFPVMNPMCPPRESMDLRVVGISTTQR